MSDDGGYCLGCDAVIWGGSLCKYCSGESEYEDALYGMSYSDDGEPKDVLAVCRVCGGPVALGGGVYASMDQERAYGAFLTCEDCSG